MSTINKIKLISPIINLLINSVSAEVSYVYVEQAQKGWHIEPLRILMEQNNLNFDVNKFTNHGCWCGKNPGTGKPQTSLDHVCHQLHQCLKCVDMEHSDECGSGFSDFWLIQADSNKPGTLGCDSTYDPCVQKRCGCAEHVLNKIVKHLEKNIGQEGDSNSCPAIHHGGNGHHQQKVLEQKMHQSELSSSSTQKPVTTKQSILLEDVPTIGELRFSDIPSSSIASTEKIPDLTTHKMVVKERLVDKIAKLPQKLVLKAANLFGSNDEFGWMDEDETIETSTVQESTVSTNRGIRVIDTTESKLIQGATVGSSETANVESVNSQLSANNNIEVQQKYASVINSNEDQEKQPVFTTSYNEEIQKVFKQQTGEATVHNACCGQYPEWFPYEEGGTNNRKCCTGKDFTHTFDSSSLKCCENGATVPSGALCPEEEPTNSADSLSLGETIYQISEEADSENFNNIDEPISSHPRPSTSAFNQSISRALSIPICDALTEELVPDNSNNWYKCQLINANSVDVCKSTDVCQYASVPVCEASTKLVAYPMDECCNYYYCAPTYIEESCDPSSCSNQKTCGKYQVKTTNLESFMDCCPETECVCDYNACPAQPNCMAGTFLLTKQSGDGCCNEYDCISES